MKKLRKVKALVKALRALFPISSIMLDGDPDFVVRIIKAYLVNKNAVAVVFTNAHELDRLSDAEGQALDRRLALLGLDRSNVSFRATGGISPEGSRFAIEITLP